MRAVIETYTGKNAEITTTSGQVFLGKISLKEFTRKVTKISKITDYMITDYMIPETVCFLTNGSYTRIIPLNEIVCISLKDKKTNKRSK